MFRVSCLLSTPDLVSGHFCVSRANGGASSTAGYNSSHNGMRYIQLQSLHDCVFSPRPNQLDIEPESRLYESTVAQLFEWLLCL